MHGTGGDKLVRRDRLGQSEIEADCLGRQVGRRGRCVLLPLALFAALTSSHIAMPPALSRHFDESGVAPSLLFLLPPFPLLPPTPPLHPLFLRSPTLRLRASSSSPIAGWLRIVALLYCPILSRHFSLLPSPHLEAYDVGVGVGEGRGRGVDVEGQVELCSISEWMDSLLLFLLF